MFKAHYRVRNTVNNIWEKYSGKPGTGLLGSHDIKAFLKEFLKDQPFNDTDLDFIILNMNTDENGKIDKYEMNCFILKISGYEKLIKPRDFRSRTKTTC